MRMRVKKIAGLAGLLVAFIILFSIPYITTGDYLPDTGMEEPKMAMRADMMESAAMAPPEEEDEQGVSPIVIVLLLSVASTLLSWTVVDKVLKEKKDVALISFADESGKQLMDALSNETCRKILELLSGSELTASQISEELDMSIQRVQYNLKKLEDTGLIVSDSYKYSEKGREMDLYRLATKYFVLGPNTKDL